MLTLRSFSQAMLVSPRRNQSNSTMIDLRCSFLVVTSGKPSSRSKRIWWPNTERVPVPVRSIVSAPWLSAPIAPPTSLPTTVGVFGSVFTERR